MLVGVLAAGKVDTDIGISEGHPVDASVTQSSVEGIYGALPCAGRAW
jgi:hypothetical protein